MAVLTQKYENLEKELKTAHTLWERAKANIKDLEQQIEKEREGFKRDVEFERGKLAISQQEAISAKVSVCMCVCMYMCI